MCLSLDLNRNKCWAGQSCWHEWPSVPGEGITVKQRHPPCPSSSVSYPMQRMKAWIRFLTLSSLQRKKEMERRREVSNFVSRKTKKQSSLSFKEGALSGGGGGGGSDVNKVGANWQFLKWKWKGVQQVNSWSLNPSTRPLAPGRGKEKPRIMT